MTERQIIDKLGDCFNVTLSSVNGIFDAMISINGRTDLCAYAICQANISDKSALTQWLKHLSTRIANDNLRKLPVVLFYSQGEKIMFSLFAYWDFDNCYINDQINWREYNNGNIPWLQLQISLRRNVVKILPEDMFRVIKTIYLNSDEISEGAIKYLRKFNSTKKYIMQNPSALTPDERLNRLLYGTPEVDYPIDDLDRIILKQVSEAYPRAQMRSSLLLFDSDLINLRLLKERKIHPLSLYLIPIKYNELGLPTNDQTKNRELKMELYYVPNFFRETQISPINQVILLDEIKDDLLFAVQNTYQPLSYINI